MDEKEKVNRRIKSRCLYSYWLLGSGETKPQRHRLQKINQNNTHIYSVWAFQSKKAIVKIRIKNCNLSIITITTCVIIFITIRILACFLQIPKAKKKRWRQELALPVPDFISSIWFKPCSVKWDLDFTKNNTLQHSRTINYVFLLPNKLY